MWRNFARVWIRSVHRHKSNSVVPVDRREQRYIIEFAASVFLLYCAWTSRGWIDRDFVVVHRLVGDVFEQLLYTEYCMGQF